MGIGLVRVRVVQIVGSDDRQVEVAAQSEQVLTHPRLDVETVVHQLEEEVAGAEQITELSGAGARLLVVADP